MTEYIVDMQRIIAIGWGLIKLTIMICWILNIFFLVAYGMFWFLSKEMKYHQENDAKYE